MNKRRTLLQDIVSLVIGIFFIKIGIDHFIDPIWFEPIVPEVLGDPTFWVYISGVFEIGLGIAIIIPKTRSWAGPSMALLLVILYWANLNMWINDIPLNGTNGGKPFEDKWHLLRGLLQLLMIGISLWVSNWSRYEWHRNWDDVDYSNLTDGTAFPPDFMWGVATAAHQIEGGNTNNWTIFEPNSKSGQLSGDACDHWNLLDEDIANIGRLNVSHYRFSIEWSRVEPAPGEWDHDAIEWYSNLVDKLLERGIKPMATLHHFTHPIWWEEKGGFQNEENIVDWIRFCEKMFSVLSDRIIWWCTINEPAVFTTMGYVLGEFPPGQRSFSVTRRVATNMMRAHARCFRTLKSMENGKSAKIGLVKNINIFDPYRRWNPLHWLQSLILDEMFNACWLRGLKNGKFRPPSSLFSTSIPGLKDSSDFIGLNYYTHLLATPFMPTKVEIDPIIRPWEIRTDFRYPMYAEGLRRSIEMVSDLDIPIIITENGVADDDDDMRPEHIRRHLLTTAEAINDGYDVRGFYHWSLLDNFEWAEGYEQQFGLYKVDFETKERRLRESGALYSNIVGSHVMPQLVILAGGLGSRLGDIAEKIPKSMISVGGKPILEHILDWAGQQGCREAVVLTGHLGEYFEGFTHRLVNLNFIKEEYPLGTGGALWNSKDHLDDRFILLWGDDLHQISYSNLLSTHLSSNCKLTMTVTEKNDSNNLEFEQNRVMRYDKSCDSPSGLNGYEAGTSIVEKSVLENHGKEGKWSWEETIYPKLGGHIAAHLDNSPFWDIGTPERLERLEEFLHSGRIT